jgi:chromate reductase, NAD(P)H dehydrogenase (quinone)
MQILAISGSLRANSSNTAILKALVGLVPDGVSISMYKGIGDLPHFNPEIDNGQLAAVNDWRRQLQAADGVIFCTPEYAHGVPGVLKNALDWIVSSGEFMNKPTAVISASPSMDGGDKANRSLVQTLRVMMAAIDEEAILCIPAVSAKLNDKGEMTDQVTVQSLQHLFDILVGRINVHSTST